MKCSSNIKSNPRMAMILSKMIIMLEPKMQIEARMEHLRLMGLQLRPRVVA